MLLENFLLVLTPAAQSGASTDSERPRAPWRSRRPTSTTRLSRVRRIRHRNAPAYLLAARPNTWPRLTPRSTQMRERRQGRARANCLVVVAIVAIAFRGDQAWLIIVDTTAYSLGQAKFRAPASWTMFIQVTSSMRLRRQSHQLNQGPTSLPTTFVVKLPISRSHRNRHGHRHTR